jgi:fluoride exporter
MVIKELLIVGCGGFFGAICRYLVSGWAQTFFKSPFPFGTLTVNSIGSLLLGFIAGLSQTAIISPQLRMFIAIGLLGAFTTFSTFSYETMMLLRSQSYVEAFLNIAISLILGIILVYIGFIVGQVVS